VASSDGGGGGGDGGDDGDGSGGIHELLLEEGPSMKWKKETCCGIQRRREKPTRASKIHLFPTSLPSKFISEAFYGFHRP